MQRHRVTHSGSGGSMWSHIITSLLCRVKTIWACWGKYPTASWFQSAFAANQILRHFHIKACLETAGVQLLSQGEKTFLFIRVSIYLFQNTQCCLSLIRENSRFKLSVFLRGLNLILNKCKGSTYNHQACVTVHVPLSAPLDKVRPYFLTATELACHKQIEKLFPQALTLLDFKLKLEPDGVWHFIHTTPVFNKINNGVSHAWTLYASNAVSSVSMTDKHEDASNGTRQLFVILLL